MGRHAWQRRPLRNKQDLVGRGATVVAVVITRVAGESACTGTHSGNATMVVVVVAWATLVVIFFIK